VNGLGLMFFMGIRNGLAAHFTTARAHGQPARERLCASSDNT
jgi:hypothetical protein